MDVDSHKQKNRGPKKHLRAKSKRTKTQTFQLKRIKTQKSTHTHKNTHSHTHTHASTHIIKNTYTHKITLQRNKPTNKKKETPKQTATNKIGAKRAHIRQVKTNKNTDL